jgi:hypothetical protein
MSPSWPRSKPTPRVNATASAIPESEIHTRTRTACAGLATLTLRMMPKRATSGDARGSPPEAILAC